MDRWILKQLGTNVYIDECRIDGSHDYLRSCWLIEFKCQTVQKYVCMENTKNCGLDNVALLSTDFQKLLGRESHMYIYGQVAYDRRGPLDLTVFAHVENCKFYQSDRQFRCHFKIMKSHNNIQIKIKQYIFYLTDIHKTKFILNPLNILINTC